MFTSRVKEVTRALQHVSYGEVRIRNYLDDEDNFANFEETIIHGLLGCAQDVSATDWASHYKQKYGIVLIQNFLPL